MIDKAFIFMILVVCAFVSGCESDIPAKQKAQHAITIERSDECHLCGMIIANFPGPKGQLYERGEDTVRKFCSTRDMFSFLLDPENTHNVESVFVHDMAITPWDNSGTEAYIDARGAWYVAKSSQPGAMGPTLASFADREVALEYIKEYGGDLYAFEEINLQMLSEIGLTKNKHHH